MIKGKYVALVEIDFSYDENKHTGIYPFEQMKQAIHNNLSDEIQYLIQDEVNGIGTAKITKQFADLYRVEGEHHG